MDALGREQERFFVDDTARSWRVDDAKASAQGSEEGAVEAVEGRVLEVDVWNLEMLPQDLDPRLESDELAHDALVDAFLVQYWGAVIGVVEERAEAKAEAGGDFECGRCHLGLHAQDVLGEFVGLTGGLGYIPDVVVLGVVRFECIKRCVSRDWRLPAAVVAWQFIHVYSCSCCQAVGRG